MKLTCINLQNGGDEYSLLVNLKRLFELLLKRNVPIEALHDDMVKILQKFRNMDDEVCHIELELNQLLVPQLYVVFFGCY